MDKPYYPLKHIASISALAKTLKVNEKVLLSVVANVNESYTPFVIESKSGKFRDVYEPKFLLKSLQKRLNSQIFERVVYPSYLQGGIKDSVNGRDYVKNAKFHSKAKTLISLDIKDFYNSIKRDQVFKIYKYFFKFPEGVAEVLTSLTTLQGKVPQGACSSSYIANLVFFEYEYIIKSNLAKDGISYSRLLDDVTLSSPKQLSDSSISNAISHVVRMFKKHGLRQNVNKKRVEHSHFKHKDYSVTGLWVGHGRPKLRKSERRYIRQLVFETEKAFKVDKTSEKYHELWNKTSGKVAKMNHLNHSKADEYRERLSKILPEFSLQYRKDLTFQVKKFVAKVKRKGYRDESRARGRYNLLFHKTGICSRTDKVLARSLKAQLRTVDSLIKTKGELWS